MGKGQTLIIVKVKARLRIYMYTLEMQHGTTSVDGEKPDNQNNLDQGSSHSGPNENDYCTGFWIVKVRPGLGFICIQYRYSMEQRQWMERNLTIKTTRIKLVVTVAYIK